MGMLWVPIQTTIIALNDMLAKFEFYGLSGITNIKRPQTHLQSRIKQFMALVFKVREVIYLIYCTLANGMTPLYCIWICEKRITETYIFVDRKLSYYSNFYFLFISSNEMNNLSRMFIFGKEDWLCSWKSERK